MKNMKQIKFKNIYSFHARIDPIKGPFSFETSPLTSEIDQAKENGAKVLGATVEIEHKLEDIIQKYLFDSSYHAEGAFFNNEILKTSFFTFAAKKQVVLSLTKNLKLLDGAKYSELQKLLKKIMLFRNAFVHGELVGFHNKNIVLLRYFSGEPKENKLTDEYWDELVKIFEETEKVIKEIEEKFNKNHLTKQST